MKKIFLSYSWADSNIADEIDLDFRNVGITLIRDIRDIPDYTSLSDYMKMIRECDYAILLISDNYLKSENCMFEVTEYFQETDFKKRIIPILLNSTEIVRNLTSQMEYIKYWEDRLREAQELIKSTDPLNAIEQTKRASRIRQITQRIGDFLAIIKDKKTINQIELKENKYKQVLGFIGIKDTDAVENLMKINKIKDKQEQAIEMEKHAEKYGKNDFFYISKGNQLYYAKEFKSAKFNYEKAIELNPKNSGAYNNLANVYLYNRDYENAKKYYELAVELEPNNAHLYNNLGALFENIDNKKAKKYYERAIDLNPGFAEAHDNLANVLSSDEYKDYANSKRHHEIALELNPKNAGIHTNYANLLVLGFNNEKKAKEHFEKAIELNPNCIEAHSGIAEIQKTGSLMDIERAKNHYEHILKLEPSDIETRFELANMLLLSVLGGVEMSVSKRNEFLINAKSHFIKAINAQENVALFHEHLASIHFLSKEYKEAKEHYEKAIELEPNNPGFHHNYANLLIAIGLQEEAKKHYDIAKTFW